jgi:hypothetical protein
MFSANYELSVPYDLQMFTEVKRKKNNDGSGKFFGTCFHESESRSYDAGFSSARRLWDEDLDLGVARRAALLACVRTCQGFRYDITSRFRWPTGRVLRYVRPCIVYHPPRSSPWHHARLWTSTSEHSRPDLVARSSLHRARRSWPILAGLLYHDGFLHRGTMEDRDMSSCQTFAQP